jgi:inosine-uridine nucleoside N-ribohydrolase
MTKVLLDTDIGTDVDDAVCLAYLLSHPECELLGITTVTGEAVKRASLASVLCKAAGREIPIFPVHRLQYHRSVDHSLDRKLSMLEANLRQLE